MSDTHIIASLINQDSILTNSLDYRGVIIPARPEEIQQQKSLKALPFISRVTNLDPIGFKIPTQLFNNSKKKRLNPTEQRNKEYIKLLSKTNKTEKEILEKQEELARKKNEKYKNSLGRQNDIINEIRKELYGEKEEHLSTKEIQEIRNEIYGDNKTNNEPIKSVNNQTKINEPPIKDTQISEKTEQKKVKKPKWAMTQHEAENLEEEKIDELLKFAENLDYEKYMKDLEIREALNMIKYKVEEKDNNQNENQENNEEVKEEKKEEAVKEEESLKLPLINSSKPLEHDQEWNGSVKVGENGNTQKQEEKIKKAVADEVLKSNSMLKQIHSSQSIKKILEREGLLLPNQSNLVISVLKERDGINNYPYKPSVLPSLREHPGV